MTAIIRGLRYLRSLLNDNKPGIFDCLIITSHFLAHLSRRLIGELIVY